MASKQEVKDQLRANTKEAKSLGLCGVPSYRVLERERGGWKAVGGVVWGQDELGVVMDLVGGWREGDKGLAGVDVDERGQGREMKL